jgi:DNA-binding CsgD family transcriptional regulator
MPRRPLLSPAERRIVREVCAGRRNGEIARRLGKNLGTVKNQLSSAYRKLGVGSRVELVLRLRRRAAG